ncbi:hypothetical protein GCM10022223_03890 [Kineosporia mesophila]|uniref:DUF2017 domain-containing protein n=1 Tax=Kineosporia mesophila TaxID=566012 RepID=A0ABP6YWG9_9ACTN|nr:DUF2017 domain-containing protein [Kineosporia mesophila]MCD5351869.1 DUF2017 domain-containing protein [Kineosporia mesophila]
MAHRKAPFKHSRAGVQVNLDDQEREILVHLLGQLDELLDDGRPAGEVDPLEALVGMRGTTDETPPATPDDPALARLLPDGNRDDPEASAEYRRLTEYGLRSRKRSGARTAAGALNRPAPVVLSSEEALSLMKALTDVRLVLGERLELKTDEDAESLHQRLWAGDEAESWMATASIYEVLTAWQEHLVVAVSKKL